MTRAYSCTSMVNIFSGTGITVGGFLSLGEWILKVLSQDPEMTDSTISQLFGYLRGETDSCGVQDAPDAIIVNI